MAVDGFELELRVPVDRVCGRVVCGRGRERRLEAPLGDFGVGPDGRVDEVSSPVAERVERRLQADADADTPSFLSDRREPGGPVEVIDVDPRAAADGGAKGVVVFVVAVQDERRAGRARNERRLQLVEAETVAASAPSSASTRRRRARSSP
jgi:hypothetical protein